MESLELLPGLAEEIAADASGLELALYYKKNPLLDRTTVEHAQSVLKSLGIPANSDSIELIALALLKAQGTAVTMLQRGIAPPALPGHRVKRHGQAIAVSEAGRLWLADMMRDGDEQWSQQTKLHRANTVRLFVDFTKDAPLDAITRADATAFRSAIAKLDPLYGKGKKNKGKTLEQLLRASPGQLTNRTLKRHMSALNLLFAWCVESGQLPEGHANPFQNMQKRQRTRRGVRKLDAKTSTGYLPYSDDELRALFSFEGKLAAQKTFSVEPKKHTAQTALLWIGLVSIYSGLRENEICGLLTTDVREAEGIPFFVIEEHDEHEGHRVKNDNAVRRVPVHSQLIELGFLRYLAHVRKQGHAYLFPGLKAGGPDRKRNAYFTKAWTNYARLVGATRKRTAFHSLRNNFTGCLEQARVHDSEVAAVVGHYKGFTFSTYSKLGLKLPVLRKRCFGALAGSA